MEAKDTVMDREETEKARKLGGEEYMVAVQSNLETPSLDYCCNNSQNLAQAEISFKAGMKEVVDWMDQFKVERLNTGKIRFVLSMDLWQAFLKSKSIEEEHEQDRN